MSSQIYVGDIGTEFRIEILEESTPVDISDATYIIIYIRKPDGSLLENTGELYTDGVDGIIFYRAIEGDLDQPGMYKIQATIEVGGGVYTSSIGTFKVNCKI